MLHWFLFGCVSEECGLIIQDQSVCPYVNDVSQSVKEFQLWNPGEYSLPYPIKRHHNMLVYILFSCHAVTDVAD